MAVDLLGKAIPDPTAPPKKWEPFYCSACAGTRSRLCSHGERKCRSCGEFSGPECGKCLDREFDRLVVQQEREL